MKNKSKPLDVQCTLYFDLTFGGGDVPCCLWFFLLFIEKI